MAAICQGRRKGNKYNGWWKRGESNTTVKHESKRKPQEGRCESAKGLNENGK